MKNHISEMSSRYLGIQVDFESNVTWSCRFGCPLDTNDARSRGEKGNSWLETKKKKKKPGWGKKAESRPTPGTSTITLQKDEDWNIKRS